MRPSDDQVADALRCIRERHRAERMNGMVLRLLLGMMAVSWLAVLLHSLWQALRR
jgi:cell division septal protein FtsQ